MSQVAQRQDRERVDRLSIVPTLLAVIPSANLKMHMRPGALDAAGSYGAEPGSRSNGLMRPHRRLFRQVQVAVDEAITAEDVDKPACSLS